MRHTTVVFVHGFISSPDCWASAMDRLQKDHAVSREAYSFDCFSYPTSLIEPDLLKQIATIDSCASTLGDYLDRTYRNERLILVGHSMGGLVIQSYLAQWLGSHRGESLARIRSVVLFATPNRGSTIMGFARSVLFSLTANAQEKNLRVLDPKTAEESSAIARDCLDATSVTDTTCPIPFRAFWGTQDKIVSEVSAKGSFDEASGLPGGHSDILDFSDKTVFGKQRYAALVDSILNPIGHPSIYEVDLLDIVLQMNPTDPATPVTLKDVAGAPQKYTDNVATRTMTITFSDQNRCRIPFEQDYRSDDGWVQCVAITGTNNAPKDDQSEYRKTGKKFTYVFTPAPGKTFEMKLRIYNGFGDGQRQWHNHMKPNANHKLIRITLDLKEYATAGYDIVPPRLRYRSQDAMDEDICSDPDSGKLQTGLPSTEVGSYSWEIPEVSGGAVSLIWDVKKKSV